LQVQFQSKNVRKSQLINNRTPQFLSMNLVKYGSDPSYNLLKNLTERIQSEKVLYIGSSTI